MIKNKELFVEPYPYPEQPKTQSFTYLIEGKCIYFIFSKGGNYHVILNMF